METAGTPETLELLQRLAAALAIGLLIGFERGWQVRDLPEGRRVAGVRTFAVLGTAGALAATLGLVFGGLVLAVAFAAVAVVLVAGFRRRKPASDGTSDLSITTEIAALATFALGALAGLGHLAPAVATAVVLTLVLGTKPELHGLLRRVRRAELLAMIRLLLITVVVLPILPDRGFGPWEALNPFRLWWMVVLVAGISAAGYLAVRLVGERKGELATGVLAGLVSSTAVTVALARRGRDRPGTSRLLAAAIALSSATMLPRVAVLAFVVSPPLAERLAWMLGPAAFVAIVAGATLAWRAVRTDPLPDDEMAPENPLELLPALRFGALLAAILVGGRALQAWLGELGVFALAVLSGFVDVDALTLTVADMARDGTLAVADAAVAVGIVVAVNTAVKPVLALLFGSRALALWTALPVGLSVAALAATAALLGGAD